MKAEDLQEYQKVLLQNAAHEAKHNQQFLNDTVWVDNLTDSPEFKEFIKYVQKHYLFVSSASPSPEAAHRSEGHRNGVIDTLALVPFLKQQRDEAKGRSSYKILDAAKQMFVS